MEYLGLNINSFIVGSARAIGYYLDDKVKNMVLGFLVGLGISALFNIEYYIQ